MVRVFPDRHCGGRPSGFRDFPYFMSNNRFKLCDKNSSRRKTTSCLIAIALLPVSQVQKIVTIPEVIPLIDDSMRGNLKLE